MRKRTFLTISILLVAVILSSCTPVETPTVQPTSVPSETPPQTSISPQPPASEQPTETRPAEAAPKTATLKLSATGDVMSHYTQILDAYNAETGEYDYSNSLSRIKNFTKTSDLLIANLETSMAEGEYTGYPIFNTPPAWPKTLRT